MNETITVSTKLTTYHCGECGGTYAIDSKYAQHKRENGGFWTCPYCKCSWGYPPDGSELARIKRQLEYTEAAAERARQATQEERQRREHTERRLSATRGVLTRTKNRVGHGVCPCCNRTFENLARHMQSKHPDYADSGDTIPGQ